MKFINFSNHPSSRWTREQLDAANTYGEVTDCPFPAVAAHASEADVNAMADKVVEEIMALEPAAVMCQGEFTLAFAVICRLIRKNVRVLTACSERMMTENGNGEKTVVFKFEGFREYNLVTGE